MVNERVLLVENKTLEVVDFLRIGETPSHMYKRWDLFVDQVFLEGLQLMLENPDEEEHWNEMIKREQNKTFTVMTCSEYQKARFTRFMEPVKVIPEEEYWSAFADIPLISWTVINDVEMFCPRNEIIQYGRFREYCFSKVVDLNDKSTWIYNFAAKYAA